MYDNEVRRPHALWGPFRNLKDMALCILGMNDAKVRYMHPLWRQLRNLIDME